MGRKYLKLFAAPEASPFPGGWLAGTRLPRYVKGEPKMKTYLYLLAAILVAVSAVGCGEVNYEPIVVNSLEDLAEPPEEVITLRSALASAASGQAIIFDESLDGGIIELSIVGNPHTMLKGEVMGMREEPSGPVSYLVGYFERDYGRSAL